MTVAGSREARGDAPPAAMAPPLPLDALSLRPCQLPPPPASFPPGFRPAFFGVDPAPRCGSGSGRRRVSSSTPLPRHRPLQAVNATSILASPPPAVCAGVNRALSSWRARGCPAGILKTSSTFNARRPRPSMRSRVLANLALWPSCYRIRAFTPRRSPLRRLRRLLGASPPSQIAMKKICQGRSHGLWFSLATPSGRCGFRRDGTRLHYVGLQCHATRTPLLPFPDRAPPRPRTPVLPLASPETCSAKSATAVVQETTCPTRAGTPSAATSVAARGTGLLGVALRRLLRLPPPPPLWRP